MYSSSQQEYKVGDIRGDLVASGTQVFPCLFLASSRPAQTDLDMTTSRKEERLVNSKAHPLMGECVLADLHTPVPSQASIMCPGQRYTGQAFIFVTDT